MFENLDNKKKEIGLKIGKKLKEKNIATNYISGYNIPRKLNNVCIYIKRKYDIKKIKQDIEKKYKIESEIIYIENSDEVDLLMIKTNEG